MKFEINHYSKNYLKVGIKLWLLKLVRRIFGERKYLSFLIILLSLVLYFTFIEVLFFIIGFISLVLIIDFVLTILNTINIIKIVNEYNEQGGESIEIFAGAYFCYVQDGIEFKKLEWENTIEYCKLKEPKSISFKDNVTKEVHIFYANEFKDGEFEDFISIVEQNINVEPIVW